MAERWHVGWRWLRLKLSQARRGYPEALGDNFPFFPCIGVRVILRLVKSNR